ncbi:hypothetical protein GCM10009534_09630 [Kribbella sandramycini]
MPRVDIVPQIARLPLLAAIQPRLGSAFATSLPVSSIAFASRTTGGLVGVGLALGVVVGLVVAVAVAVAVGFGGTEGVGVVAGALGGGVVGAVTLGVGGGVFAPPPAGAVWLPQATNARAATAGPASAATRRDPRVFMSPTLPFRYQLGREIRHCGWDTT